jgi:hypothetical protein
MVATRPKPSPPGSSPRDGDARGSRPLSTPAAIGVAGLAAAAVIGVGIFIAERGEPSRPAASDAIAPIPPVAAPPSLAPTGRAPSPSAVTPTASAAPSASSSTAPIAAVKATSTAAEAASAATEKATASAPAPAASPLLAPLPPTSLPPQLGYLAVRTQGEARVYVNGVDIGPTNRALETLCGLRYVRIGTVMSGGSPPTWFGAGQSVAIGCRTVTELSAPPSP